MRIFCYFVEPASYTIDLIKNIYEKHNIDYLFFKSTTFSRSNIISKAIFLDNLSIINRLKLLISNYRNNDLIIINGYNNYTFFITFLYNLFSFNKRFIAIDSDTQLLFSNNLIKRVFKWIYLSVVFRSKYVLGFAGGSKNHKDLFRHYGMRENRIFLMPMMVDNLRFYQSEKLFSKKFTFLYVGRLVKHKNVENLIQQFNKYFLHEDVTLKIIGSGKEEIYLKKKYASQRIIFLGEMLNNDIIPEFKNANCLVLPSIFEPWGLVINEALSAGLPVITIKGVGANSDLINGKGTGIIASNMNEFGEKMLELYNNPDLLMKFSKNAQDLMINHWNYRLYEKCLQDVIVKVKRWG